MSSTDKAKRIFKRLIRAHCKPVNPDKRLNDTDATRIFSLRGSASWSPINYLDHAPERYVNILFDTRVISAIDDFRFTHRIQSRTEAIRKLIEYALKHQKESARAR